LPTDLSGSDQIHLRFANTTQLSNIVTIQESYGLIPVAAVIQSAIVLPLEKVDVGHTKEVYQVQAPVCALYTTSIINFCPG
jgi:hypothetical protein